MEKQSKDKTDPFLDLVIFNKYKLVEKLGQGSFGVIYKAAVNSDLYAIKMEKQVQGKSSLLKKEADMMKNLDYHGVPKIYKFLQSKGYNIMVMELLGKSLEDFKVEHKTFSIKTVAMIGIEIINIFQYLHDNDLIHRDIKPDNFAVGYNDKSRIYIFDFGLSKRYRSIATGAHNPMMKENKLTGTARYASINALLGFEQSRRDDLEAMSYMLMYFLRDKLPWQGLVVKQKENRYAKILEKKQSFPLSMLCEGFPRQFEELISYTRNLLYEENPNYDYMKNLMLSVLKNIDAQPDLHFDWFTEEDILKLEQKHSISQTGDDNDNNNVENRDTQRDNTEAMDPKALNQPVDLNVEDKKKRNGCCCLIV